MTSTVVRANSEHIFVAGHKISWGEVKFKEYSYKNDQNNNPQLHAVKLTGNTTDNSVQHFSLPILPVYSSIVKASQVYMAADGEETNNIMQFNGKLVLTGKGADGEAYRIAKDQLELEVSLKLLNNNPFLK